MYWSKKPPKEFNPKKRLGHVHVYTGDGKGKTSAALGVAFRAAGHKMQVLIVQFIKGHKDYGEMFAHESLKPYVDIVQFGTLETTDLENPSTMDKYVAERGMEFIRETMINKRPDILVLDELNVAMHYGLVKTDEVLDFIDNKHQNTEVIITGRHAPKSILNAADLVTVMTTTKHPYDEDHMPRKGIEH